MASPVDSARINTDIATAATSHTINVGSPVAGTLLIVLVRFAGAPGTVTFTGYTQLLASTADASDDEQRVYYRWADGSEGATDAMSTINSIKLAAICIEVTGAENPATQAPQSSAVAIGATTDPGCLTITPTGGSKDYLFIATVGMDGETQTASLAAGEIAEGWGNVAQANSGTGGAVATNVRIATASNPRTAADTSLFNCGFTMAAPQTGYMTHTLAIHPPAAAAAPGPASSSRQRRAHRFLTSR